MAEESSQIQSHPLPTIRRSDLLADKEFMNAFMKVSEAILKAGQDLLELREALRDQTPDCQEKECKDKGLIAPE